MRGQLRLENGTIVREVRPIDYCNALLSFRQTGAVTLGDVDSTMWDKVFFNDGDLIEGVVDEVSSQAFMALNDDFFITPKVVTPNSERLTAINNARQLSVIIKELNTTCAVLISHNHQNCWLYGWQFFQIVQGLYKDK